MKRPRLTWRKEPNETGLARVCQGPRGFELRHAGVRVGSVAPSTGMGNARYTINGWYCYGSWIDWGVPSINTCQTLVKTPEEAKEILMAHFREHIDRFLENADV